MNRSNWLRIGTAAIAAVSSLMPACQNKTKDSGSGAGSTPNANAVKVELFVMSQCPYGVKAEDAIIPALEKFGNNVDLHIDYIGSGADPANLSSMHGPKEVAGDIAQLCALKLAPKNHRKFIACVNKEWHSIPDNSATCATESGIDAAKFKACTDGADGKSLLAASFKRSEEAKAQGSPTIKIGGKDYEGPRGPSDIMRAVCAAYGDKKQPEACSNIPKPPEVKVTVLTDKRCKECDPTPVLNSLKQVFPALQPKIVDWSDPEAKTIAGEAQVKLLPAVLFDDSIDKDKEGSQQLARWLTPAGKYKSLRVPAEFDPTAEICDNKVDDNNDSKIDCDDPTCKDNMACRAEKKGALDVFVMSQCPYGVMGLNAMKDVLDAFGSEMTFTVHYIAEGKDGAFTSMHGAGEVDEDLREVCAAKHYAKSNKYMEYVWCRNKDIRSTDWQKCATGGIDAKVIEKCSTGDEGKTLLAADIKVAQGMKIGASPTWLANNRKTFSGVSAPDIQKAFCENNPGLKGCSKTLAAPAPQQQAAPQGGSCGGH
jgi:predicted DsbA family dithiol-disulfide isomerase